MRVSLPRYGSRGDIEPMEGLAVRTGAPEGRVPVCAPPDFAELPADVGMPRMPIGRPVRPPVTTATPPSSADLPPRAAELVAARFDPVAAAAEECNAPVATGSMPTGGWR